MGRTKQKLEDGGKNGNIPGKLPLFFTLSPLERRIQSEYPVYSGNKAFRMRHFLPRSIFLTPFACFDTSKRTRP